MNAFPRDKFVQRDARAPIVSTPIPCGILAELFHLSCRKPHAGVQRVNASRITVNAFRKERPAAFDASARTVLTIPDRMKMSYCTYSFTFGG